MAAETLQERKEQLVRAIIEKRTKIASSAERMQGALPVKLEQVQQVRNLVSAQSSGSSKGLLQQVLSSGVTKQAPAVLAQLKQVAQPIASLSKRVPLKPFLIGLGGAVLLTLVLGKTSKRKRKHKQREKERKQVAKYGFGILILKWLLAASQPALKKALLHAVKNVIVK